MTEDRFINYISKNVKNNIIGDDCAVIPLENFSHDSEKISGQYVLIATDTINEKVHFSLDYFSLYDIGYKSLAVNLSDIAACAGIPLYYQVSLTVPPYIKPEMLEHVYKGFETLSNKYNLILSGGDTVAGRFLSICVTVIGKTSNPVLRKNAGRGENVYVTGELGSSSYALDLFQKKLKVPDSLKKKHLTPEPRINVLNNLMKTNKITSCIDISDGLALDIYRLKSAATGFEINYNDIPKSDELKKMDIEEQLGHMLNGGEDFELLFTSPDDIKNEDVYKIGTTNKTGKAELIINNNRCVFNPKPYKHF